MKSLFIWSVMLGIQTVWVFKYPSNWMTVLLAITFIGWILALSHINDGGSNG